MAFATSFLTGMLQRKLDNWGQEDAQIADRIQKIGEQLVTADDNATEKVSKLGKVAGVLNSKYGQNGIYQLAYQVDNNAIDFNDDVDDIADRVAQFQIPEDYKSSISNPYDYLGEQTQAMYDNDMAAYNSLYSNVNVGNKTAEMLVPKRDYKASYAGLEEAPTIGAEPITSAYPGKTEADFKNNAYSKMAFLAKNNIPISQAMNPELGDFALNKFEFDFLDKELKGNTSQEILNDILIHASEEYAGAKVLTKTEPAEILKGIEKILALGNFDDTYTSSEISTIQGDVDFNKFIQQDNVYTNVDALSNYQKNLPRVFVDMDALSNEEANEILNNIEEGTIIEFKKNGQNYFVES